MYRFLREQDRELNKDSYPKLNYPEVYVLEGGYKAFYEKHEVINTLLSAYEKTHFTCVIKHIVACRITRLPTNILEYKIMTSFCNGLSYS